jgi:NAD-dependent DNA ligase
VGLYRRVKRLKPKPIAQIKLKIRTAADLSASCVESEFALKLKSRWEGMAMDEKLINRFSGKRLASRQVDELVGLARGLTADGKLNHQEVEFLQAWLAANMDIVDNPMISILYERIASVMKDGVADEEECTDLFETLHQFVNGDVAVGEALKSTSLPLCQPLPSLSFEGKRYCFTGTFTYGERGACEQTVKALGATAGGIAQKTNVLVIGSYATEAWKHSNFGNKIMQAVEWRDAGHPISIVSEAHWVTHL